MKKTTDDHAISAIKAGIAAIPVFGGVLSSLIADYIPDKTNESVETAISYLRYRTELLDNRIDLENVNKDEFSELFKSCYLTILRTHKKEKLEAAVNLITNALLKGSDEERLSFTEADHFSHSLEQRSYGSIHVLLAAAKIVERSYNGDISAAVHGDFNEGRRFQFSDLSKELDDYHPSLLMGLVSELDTLNLVHKAGTPSIRVQDYANYPIELTILGIKFIVTALNIDSNNE